MTANQMEKQLDTFFSDYDGNKYKLFDGYDLDILKAQRKKLRENQQEMQKSVYNNMSKNQMYANIGKFTLLAIPFLALRFSLEFRSSVCLR